MLNRYLLGLVFVFRVQRLPAQTREIDSLRIELRKEVNDSIQGDLNLEMAFRYLFLNRDSSIKYIKKAEALAHSQGMEKLKIRAKQAKARLLADIGNFV